MDKSILRILQYAMRMEKNGQQFYLHHQNKVNNPRIKQVFKRLAQIEDEHYQRLERMHEAFETGAVDKKATLEGALKMDEGSSLFATRGNTISSRNLNDDAADLVVLRMAYLLEDDFAKYYQKAADSLDDTIAKEFLESMAKWEAGHRDAFYEEYQQLQKEFWFEQRFYPF